MDTTAANQALLLFRVGPVLCCAPTAPVVAIVQPKPLHRPPGSNAAAPGIFKHGGHIVSTRDLRQLFGVDPDKFAQPGRLVITEQPRQQLGFFVDEIIEVMQLPQQGFGPLPALLPRGVFSRTLLLHNKIYLYSEFAKLATLTGGGYLRAYIAQLEPPQPATVVATPTSPIAVVSPVSTASAAPFIAPRVTTPSAPKKGTDLFFAATPEPITAPAHVAPAQKNKSVPFLTKPVIPREQSTQVPVARPAIPSPLEITNINSSVSVWPFLGVIVVGLACLVVWWQFARAPVTPPVVTAFTIAPAITTAAIVPSPPAVPQEPALPATPQQYQATITQEPDGITIVLDNPAEEPAFTLPAGASQQPSGQPLTEITHVVIKGDTLWHIAKRYVHNPYRYPELARLSNIANPDLIYPGNRVRIIQRR